MRRLSTWLRGRKDRLVAGCVASTARVRHNTLVYRQQAELAREALADMEARLAEIDAVYAADGDQFACAAAKLRVLKEVGAAQERRRAAVQDMLLP